MLSVKPFILLRYFLIILFWLRLSSLQKLVSLESSGEPIAKSLQLAPVSVLEFANLAFEAGGMTIRSTVIYISALLTPLIPSQSLLELSLFFPVDLTSLKFSWEIVYYVKWISRCVTQFYHPVDLF